MRSLVTGGAGFIGSHICEELLRMGHEVVCIDNLSSGMMENIKMFVGNPDYRFYCMDIRDDLGEAMKDIDVVFHNACSKCTVCVDNPMRDSTVNSYGSFNVFDSARKAGVKKVVHASTGSTMDGSPQSYYGVSKLAAENYARVIRANYNYPIQILRYYHVYGTRQDSSDKGGVIPIFIRRIQEGKPLIVHGGSQIRHFTSVKDIVKANMIAAGSDELIDCDVVSDVSYTIHDLAIELSSIMDVSYKAEIVDGRVGEIYRFNIDNKPIKKLGMVFDNDLRKNLELMVNECQSAMSCL